MNKSLLIEELAQRIRAIRPERIVLFGSHAQGNPLRESDIDLLVVANSDLMRLFARNQRKRKGAL